MYNTRNETGVNNAAWTILWFSGGQELIDKFRPLSGGHFRATFYTILRGPLLTKNFRCPHSLNNTSVFPSSLFRSSKSPLSCSLASLTNYSTCMQAIFSSSAFRRESELRPPYCKQLLPISGADHMTPIPPPLAPGDWPRSELPTGIKIKFSLP